MPYPQYRVIFAVFDVLLRFLHRCPGTFGHLWVFTKGGKDTPLLVTGSLWHLWEFPEPSGVFSETILGMSYAEGFGRFAQRFLAEFLRLAHGEDGFGVSAAIGEQFPEPVPGVFPFVERFALAWVHDFIGGYGDGFGFPLYPHVCGVRGPR